MVLLTKCKFIMEKSKFSEKACYLAITSRYIYTFQYNEILECYPIKKMERMQYSKKREQLRLYLGRDDVICLKVNQRYLYLIF